MDPLVSQEIANQISGYWDRPMFILQALSVIVGIIAIGGGLLAVVLSRNFRRAAAEVIAEHQARNDEAVRQNQLKVDDFISRAEKRLAKFDDGALKEAQEIPKLRKELNDLKRERERLLLARPMNYFANNSELIRKSALMRVLEEKLSENNKAN